MEHKTDTDSALLALRTIANWPITKMGQFDAMDAVNMAAVARNALASLAASAGSEPVAWQCRHLLDGSWQDCNSGVAAVRSKRPDKWAVRPLYTHPSPPEGMTGAKPLIARALGEWHEDDGPVMWWAWNGRAAGWAGEPAWCGTPLSSDWPGYHTHWTPHPAFPIAAGGGKEADHG